LNAANRHTCFAQQGFGAAGRNQLEAERFEPSGKVNDAGFVVDRQNRPQLEV
jgi:hypothetical protein